MPVTTFVKPPIQFPMFPVIFGWIESAYNKVESYEQFTEFIHGCMTEAENTKNEVKRNAYLNIAAALYSAETNKSYESKNFQIHYDSL